MGIAEFLCISKSFWRMFAKCWIIDAVFFLAIGVIVASSFFGFGALSQKAEELSAMPASEQLANEFWSLLSSYLAMTAILFILSFVAYVFFQSLLWSMLTGQQLSFRQNLGLAAFTVIIWIIYSVIGTIAGMVAYLAYAVLGRAPAIASAGGAVLAIIIFSALLPWSVLPFASFFSEKNALPALAKTFHTAIITLPKMWKKYLAGGVFFFAFSQLYRLFPSESPYFGMMLFLLLIVSPFMAWYRIFVEKELANRV